MLRKGSEVSARNYEKTRKNNTRGQTVFFFSSHLSEAHVKLGGGWRSIASLESASEAELKTLLFTGKGNDQVNAELEAELPVYFRRPWPGPSCFAFIRENFVHLKYIVRAFCKGATCVGLQVGFSNTQKSGQLLKKSREGANFSPRLFEVNSTTNSLKYFVKLTDTTPKECIDLERCNMTFVDSKAFGVPPHTLLLQFVQGNATRHIFIRSEDNREIINWYNTMRLCKYQRLQLHLSGTGQELPPLDEILSHLTFDLERCGWLQKGGPDSSYFFKRRWLILSKRCLSYSCDPLSAFAKGEVFIGSAEEGFWVEAKAPETWKKLPTEFPLTVGTPERAFVFCATTLEERDRWFEALLAITKRPVTLLDRKEAAHIISKIK